MMWRLVSVGCLVACSLGVVAQAQQPVAFTEDFATSTAAWATGAYTVPGFQATGGPDGNGYIQSPTLMFSQFTGSFSASALLFRAEPDLNSSDHAFEGNWLDKGFVGLSFFVRHNAPVPVEFFGRIATPNNARGAAATNGQLVEPNVWTQVILDLNRENNDIISYGSAGSLPDPYGAIFGSVGRVQINAFRPAGLTPEQLAAPLVFELDQVSVHVPEPSTILLIGIGMLLVAGRLGLHRAVR